MEFTARPHAKFCLASLFGKRAGKQEINWSDLNVNVHDNQAYAVETEKSDNFVATSRKLALQDCMHNYICNQICDRGFIHVIVNIEKYH